MCFNFLLFFRCVLLLIFWLLVSYLTIITHFLKFRYIKSIKIFINVRIDSSCSFQSISENLRFKFFFPRYAYLQTHFDKLDISIFNGIINRYFIFLYANTTSWISKIYIFTQYSLLSLSDQLQLEEVLFVAYYVLRRLSCP